MIGFGTLINVLTIVIGGSMGLVAGRYISAHVKETLTRILGLATAYIAIDMMVSSRVWLLPAIGCLLLGGLIGALINIEYHFERFAQYCQRRFAKQNNHQFAEGMITASLLFCVGAMAIIGSIQDAAGDARTLLIKAMLDGVAAMTLAASLGVGVLASAGAVLAYQGLITLLASVLPFLGDEKVLLAINATGGMMILSISINLLELGHKRIPIGNFLPAIVFALSLPSL